MPDLTAAPSGTLTAHEISYLVLLRSRPDTVRRLPLRETRLQRHNQAPRQCTALLLYVFPKKLSTIFNYYFEYFICAVTVHSVHSNTLRDANACKSNFAEYGL